jgi:hypothetical protein
MKHNQFLFPEKEEKKVVLAEEANSFFILKKRG